MGFDSDLNDYVQFSEVPTLTIWAASYLKSAVTSALGAVVPYIQHPDV